MAQERGITWKHFKSLVEITDMMVEKLWKK
jgi:hypothetical protein